MFSIGIVLFRENLPDRYTDCLNDLLIGGGLRLVRLDHEGLLTVSAITRQFRLDFDDAYQYAVATKFNLEIISFDADFDRTDRGRKTPQQICP